MADAQQLCVDCGSEGRVRRAYFTRDGCSVCIRHAAERTFPEDDMRAHDMAHALYQELHGRGDPQAY